jgi:phosphoenolpyruvate-protein phosphotransferase
MPLDDLPDAAFAERMVGEGAAIDPVDSVLLAPCDGEVIMLSNAGHAVVVRAENGAEILMHVGIDTVSLQGAGLCARVTQGQRVRRGDALICMDLDRLIYGAKSLITPVVVTNSERYEVSVRAQHCLLSAGDAFLEIEPLRTDGKTQGDAIAISVSPDASIQLTVRLKHGIHARPAARIARASKRFEARITVSVHGRDADARSATALMALGVRCGDPVELRSHGAGASEAIRAVAAEIERLMDEAPIGRQMLVQAKKVSSESNRNDELEVEVHGIVASRGIAIGVAQQFRQAQVSVPEEGGSPDEELAALERALAEARHRLERMLAGGRNDILDAHIELLDDPALREDARNAIEAGKSAGRAWQIAIAAANHTLTSVGDARVAERTADLRDLEAQVLEALTCPDDSATFRVVNDAIVLAAELLPSQLARLDLTKVAGICTAEGGPTSHVALLAASMAIPAMVGAGGSILRIANGARLILDADEGVLHVEPDAGKSAALQMRLAERSRKTAAWRRDALADCYTADGCRIEVFANLASEAEALEAVAQGAEGCGLLRTEFLFLDRRSAPTEQEQTAEYRKIAEALGGRPLAVRTLDVGGDKPIAYLPLPREENPLLGLRGLRIGLLYPQVLRDQLASILQVAPASQCRILLPMVTEAEEIRDVRRILDDIREERHLEVRPLLGAMMETPASVMLADTIAREADFLSIGSNDLAQYTLAMDRGHPQLASRFDFFQPAVLRQIAHVCRAADAADCRVSVCGALASEPLAAAILIGIGVRTLSAVPAVIPELKTVIRGLCLADCEQLARAVMAEDSASSIRALASEFPAGKGEVLQT